MGQRRAQERSEADQRRLSIKMRVEKQRWLSARLTWFDANLYASRLLIDSHSSAVEARYAREGG